MDARVMQNDEPGRRFEPVKADGEAPAMEELLAGTRDFLAETADHVRGNGELAFLELDLAISTLKWWILAIALCSVTSIMACTFIAAGILLVFTDTAFSPIAAMLGMGGLLACVAGLLFLCLNFLSRKLTFRTLRDHLTRPQVAPHVPA